MRSRADSAWPEASRFSCGLMVCDMVRRETGVVGLDYPRADPVGVVGTRGLWESLLSHSDLRLRCPRSNRLLRPQKRLIGLFFRGPPISSRQGFISTFAFGNRSSLRSSGSRPFPRRSCASSLRDLSIEVVDSLNPKLAEGPRHSYRPIPAETTALFSVLFHSKRSGRAVLLSRFCSWRGKSPSGIYFDSASSARFSSSTLTRGSPRKLSCRCVV